jgi:16S rRNA (guanine527-N7)-methyltransferase
MIEPDTALLDIGSGGGFPGIPMKIMEPSLAVTLIDASRKKVSFLKHLIRTLKLEKVEARHVRAEDFIKERKVQNSFDVVVSRALASIENLVTLAAPLLKRGGTIIALKGPELHKEIEAVCPQVAHNNGVMKIADIRFSVKFKRYSLPHLGLQRAIIALRIFL